MKRLAVTAIIVLALGTGCTSRRASAVIPLRVYASSAATPWLETAYGCAPTGSAVLLTSPSTADLILNLSESAVTTGPAYQVGTDDLLVIVHPSAAIGTLSASEVEAVFTGVVKKWSDLGGADQEIQVWAYAPTVDIQAYFDRVMLNERPISSLARLAVSAQHMSDSVGANPGSVGLLPRRWKTGNTRDVFAMPGIPVLALVKQEPVGPLANLIACMQSPH